MHRKSRSSTMGLLDGLQSLQGPPPPRPNPNDPTTHSSNDPIAQFSTNAKSIFGDLTSSFSDNFDNIGDNFKSSVSSLRRLVGDDSVPPADLEAQIPAQPPQQSFSEEMGALFNLTFFQRLALFAMIFATGILMICISFSFLPLIVLMPHKFAAAFTMGNVLAIASTWVLVGPRAQLQTMFHPVRAVAAAIYVTSLVVALVAAFFGGKFRYVIVLVALVAELVSLVWYALSYIPYGRHMMSRLFNMLGLSG